MRRNRLVLALCLAGLSPPAWANSALDSVPDAVPDAGQGMSLIERGAQMILRSMLDEMRPSLDEMQGEMERALADMQPALAELARLIGDIRNYDLPEMLPNGDIIIRRKAGAPPADRTSPAPRLPGSETEIDL